MVDFDVPDCAGMYGTVMGQLFQGMNYPRKDKSEGRENELAGPIACPYGR